MSFTASIIFRDRQYLYIFGDHDSFLVGETDDADAIIPGLGRALAISCIGNVVQVTDSIGKKTVQWKIDLNEVFVLDASRKLAILVSEAAPAAKQILLPENFDIKIGRSATDRKDWVMINLPFVSREHCRIIRLRGEIYVLDEGSKNGIYLNGKKVQKAMLHDGDILSILTVQLTLNGDRLMISNALGNVFYSEIRLLESRREAPLCPIEDAKIWYRRSPRLGTFIGEKTIRIERPPQAGGKPHINWFSVLISPVVTVGLMVALVYFMGMSPVMLVMTGVTTILSMVAAVVSHRNQKKRSGEQRERIDSTYQKYLQTISDQLERAHNQEATALWDAHPSPEDCCELLKRMDSAFWSRCPDDRDFLTVRLGIGNIRASVSAAYEMPQIILEENPLELDANELANNSGTLNDVPVCCDLKQNKQIALIGDRANTLPFVRSLVTELTTFHSCDELKIVTVFAPSEQKHWEWMRWLPHCADNERTSRYLISDLSDDRMDRICEILSARMREKEVSLLPHFLFIVSSQSVLGNHPLKKAILSNVQNGCSAMFLSEHIASCPKECTCAIQVQPDSGEIYSVSATQNRTNFSPDAISLEKADHFARTMAPIHIEVEGGAAKLPKRVSFLEGYGAENPKKLCVLDRWKRARGYNSLSVPFAVLPDGEKFYFDIHQAKQGVHGIIAGMTGSGKTEMVQSWLLSLAVNFSPRDVSFLLIDFKGTGLIAPFIGLPHVAGTISNLDTPSDIDRNLIAIRSEMKRRMAIIDRYTGGTSYPPTANSVNRLYHSGEIKEHLPILLIVIDEFAEFKKAYPEFGNEIVSLTNVGRSLGMYAILMAQSPSGIVPAKAEDNISFRWCLRVTDPSASKYMLNTTDAVKIGNPGRAYIKVDNANTSSYDQVQSYWSGAPFYPNRSSWSPDTEITPIMRVELSGRKQRCERVVEQPKGPATSTEISAVISHIVSVCEENGIAPADQVWCPYLPKRISIDRLLPAAFNGRQWPHTIFTAPVLGLVDDPENQRQYSLVMKLEEAGNTVIYGMPGTGKTTLLQTMVMSMALTRRPDQVSIYIMDLSGSNHYTALAQLPHIGGIATLTQSERLRKLALLLGETLQSRKAAFSRRGVGNITAYRTVTGEELPDIVLLVDRFSKDMAELEDFFLDLAASGVNYGMYLVATVAAEGHIPYKLQPFIKSKFTFAMSDKSDYNLLVGRPRAPLSPVTGRAFMRGEPPLEFQAALPAPGADDVEVLENVRRFASAMSNLWTAPRPAPIPELPETIWYGTVSSEKIVLGLSCEKVTPVCYEWEKQHYLMISGMEQAETTNLLWVIMGQMKEKLDAKLYLFDISGNSRKQSDHADAYLSSAEQIDAFVESIRPELQRRLTEKTEDDSLEFPPIVIAVDDYGQFFQQVSNDTIARLTAVLRLGGNLDLYLLIAGDAYALSSLVNRGETVSMTASKGKQAVMSGGCMNDHAAIQTKAAYAQMGATLSEQEAIFIQNQQPVKFLAMRKDRR